MLYKKKARVFIPGLFYVTGVVSTILPGSILQEVTIICLMQINLGIFMPFFHLYELNFRSMRVINFENLHIPMQNHIFTIPIDNGK